MTRLYRQSDGVWNGVWAMRQLRCRRSAGLKPQDAARLGLSAAAAIASLSQLFRIDNTADADGDGAQLSAVAGIAIAVFALSIFAASFVSGAGQ